MARTTLLWTLAALLPIAVLLMPGLLAWHRELIRLRRSHPALGPGRFEDVDVHWSEDERWIVVVRSSPDRSCRAVLVANLGDVKVRVPLPDIGDLSRVLASSVNDLNVPNGAVELAPLAVILCD